MRQRERLCYFSQSQARDHEKLLVKDGLHEHHLSSVLLFHGLSERGDVVPDGKLQAEGEDLSLEGREAAKEAAKEEGGKEERVRSKQQRDGEKKETGTRRKKEEKQSA